MHENKIGAEMDLKHIPKTLQKKNNIGAYTHMYVEIYLEEKKVQEGMSSIGEALNEVVRNQPDFEEMIKKHLIFLKKSF